MPEDCLFCRIAAGAQPAKIVHEDDTVVAFEDINPQAPTHLLIIPREHVESINDLTEEHTAIVGRVVTAAREIAEAHGFAPDGYRLVINCGASAGQVVMHLHAHLLAGRDMGWPPG